jgi:hypothetical protein
MRCRMSIAVALLVAAAIFVTAPATAATVIGRTGGNVPCGGEGTAIQTGVASSGASFTVPAGTWTLDGWSTEAGAGGGQMAAVVVRPTGTPDQYTVVGVSATENLTANTLNTFETSISVRGGDLLGFWATAPTNCAQLTGDPGDTLALAAMATKPSAGDILTLPPGGGFLLNISAALTSGAGTKASEKKGSQAAPPPREPDHAFLCYSRFQIDPGSWLTSEAAALIAQGYWLPYAEKTVATGTAIGSGYYLSCQQFAATGNIVNADGVNLGQSTGLANAPGYYPEGT